MMRISSPFLLLFVSLCFSSCGSQRDAAAFTQTPDYHAVMELCKTGATDKCVAQLQAALALHPDQSHLYYHLGQAFRNLVEGDENRLAAAEAAYRSAIRIAERTSDTAIIRNARLFLGRTYIDLSQWSDAIREFDAIMALNPDVILPEALYRLLYLQHFACNFTKRPLLLRSARETLAWELESGDGGSR